VEDMNHESRHHFVYSLFNICSYCGVVYNNNNNNNNIIFIEFGSQEGWITTNIQTCTGRVNRRGLKEIKH